MFKSKKILVVASVIMSLLFTFSHASAADGKVKTQEYQGTVDRYDAGRRLLIVGDLPLTLSQDVKIKTRRGNEGTLSMLYTGKKIKLEVDFDSPERGGTAGLIHRIYLQ
jgi:hypothetical protein